uniref:Uncharacterized protein n=1 Tax=Rhizophora mucronata TaxID=61149 RepID=A0A2P2QHK2_RHIMU
MESSLNNMVIPTFPRKQRTAHKKEKSVMVNFKPSRCKRPSSEKLLRRRCRHHPRISRSETREMKVQETADVKLEGVGNCEDDDDDKEAVDSKIAALQRIVPGGHSLVPDKLFEQTACYILALQCQIKAMRLLATLLEGLEKDKTKFGG